MRRVVLVALVLVSTAVAGCTTLQPVTGQAYPLGMVLALSINDAGRAALSGRMGQGITDIEGRLIRKDSAGYVLAVSQVQTYRDGTQVWSGERIEINNEFVNVAQEKKFSRAKTAILSASVIGLVAILASQGVLGSLAGDDVKPPIDTGLTNRIPLLLKR